MLRFLALRALLPVMVVAPVVLCGGCGRDPEPPAETANVAAPPSVRVAEAGGGALVRLDSAQAAELKIRSVRVASDNFQYTLSLPGTVYPAPENLSQVSAPIGGRVARIYAHEGQAVRRGQVLLELESLAFANLAADYLQATAEETYQRSQVERLELLVEKKISPRSALDKVQADLSRASASVSASFARLRAVGVSEAQIQSWTASQKDRPLLRVYAPLSGIISEHLIDQGQSVNDYQHLLTIVDLSRVLIKGYVSPEDAPLLAAGAPVIIGREGDTEQNIQARILTINPSVDPQNRSVTVNILAPTRGNWPIPGQSVRLQLQVRTPQPVMTIPLSAVQYEGDRATVFVRRDAATFERRPVMLRKVTAEDVVVESGLRDGEEIAVSQVFSLKALARFEQYAEE